MLSYREPEFRVVLSGESEALLAVRGMFEEYQRELGVDLCFQSFQEELDTLPGKYGPPGGVLYLVFVEDELAACGALRPLEPGICEIKRVYVRPAFRRLGLARRLSQRLLEDATRLHYRLARLDTLARLSGAVSMYRSLGFVETQPYNYNPESDILYFEKGLLG